MSGFFHLFAHLNFSFSEPNTSVWWPSGRATRFGATKLKDESEVKGTGRRHSGAVTKSEAGSILTAKERSFFQLETPNSSKSFAVGKHRAKNSVREFVLYIKKWAGQTSV